MTNSRIIGGVFLIVSLLYGWAATQIPLDFWSEQEAFNARSLPYGLATAGSLIAALLLLIPDERTDFEFLLKLKWSPALLLLALLAIYGLSFEVLGYFVATAGLLAGGFMIMGERRPGLIVMISAGVTLGFWGIMTSLDIYLTPGEWWFWLRGSNA